jgi:hypothetical protein
MIAHTQELGGSTIYVGLLPLLKVVGNTCVCRSHVDFKAKIVHS